MFTVSVTNPAPSDTVGSEANEITGVGSSSWIVPVAEAPPPGTVTFASWAEMVAMTVSSGSSRLSATIGRLIVPPEAPGGITRVPDLLA